MVQAVQDVHALDRAVGARVEVPGDDFVFVARGFFLKGVVEDQHAILRFDGADGRLHPRPQAAGGMFRPRQEPGDLVMADRLIQQGGQPGRSDQQERTE